MTVPLVKAEMSTAEVLPLEPKRPPIARRIAARLREIAVRVVPPVVVITLTLVIWVGTGIALETGCVNVCCRTVMLPLEAAAKPCICPNTQSVAAPMPRFGSVWLDSVFLVPNETSFSMVAWIRWGSIWLISARRAGSKSPVSLAEPTLAEAALAGATTETRGTAAAVTAEAERNARRLGPFEPGT